MLQSGDEYSNHLHHVAECRLVKTLAEMEKRANSENILVLIFWSVCYF